MHLHLLRQQVLILISLLLQIFPEGFIRVTKPTVINHPKSLLMLLRVENAKGLRYHLRNLLLSTGD